MFFYTKKSLENRQLSSWLLTCNLSENLTNTETYFLPPGVTCTLLTAQPGLLAGRPTPGQTLLYEEVKEVEEVEVEQ